MRLASPFPEEFGILCLFGLVVLLFVWGFFYSLPDRGLLTPINVSCKRG